MQTASAWMGRLCEARLMIRGVSLGRKEMQEECSALGYTPITLTHEAYFDSREYNLESREWKLQVDNVEPRGRKINATIKCHQGPCQYQGNMLTSKIR